MVAPVPALAASALAAVAPKTMDRAMTATSKRISFKKYLLGIVLATRADAPVLLTEHTEPAFGPVEHTAMFTT
jgi:hypothetical protein